MRAHWAYFKYVARHKWFVFLACFKYGVPLWQGIIHDLSKYTSVEWSPYVHQFFNSDGSRRKVRDSSGAYDPNAQPDEFKRAWLNHQRNYHHWQAWISIGDGGSLSVLPMPERYAREMIADWAGAGRAISGEKSPNAWYGKNCTKMILHPNTRILIEDLMSL